MFLKVLTSALFFQPSEIVFDRATNKLSSLSSLTSFSFMYSHPSDNYPFSPCYPISLMFPSFFFLLIFLSLFPLHSAFLISICYSLPFHVPLMHAPLMSHLPRSLPPSLPPSPISLCIYIYISLSLSLSLFFSLLFSSLLFFYLSIPSLSSFDLRNLFIFIFCLSTCFPSSSSISLYIPSKKWITY